MKIWFTDFWSGWAIENNYFIKILDKYGVKYTLDSNNPDLLVFSVFGNNNISYNCIKLLYTGEPSTSIIQNKKIITKFHTFPNNDIFVSDYTIGSEYIINENYLRIPLYFFWEYWNSLKPIDTKFKNHPKTKFCSIVCTNFTQNRLDFLKELTYYKQADIASNTKLNIPTIPIGLSCYDKLMFIRNYKFNISFENMDIDGYVSEKIYDSFSAGCIPIYRGSKNISSEFCKKYFLDFTEFNNYKSLIQKIIDIDKNDCLYTSMIPKNDEYKLYKFDEMCKNIYTFFKKILK